jgi:hypothetical protein
MNYRLTADGFHHDNSQLEFSSKIDESINVKKIVPSNVDSRRFLLDLPTLTSLSLK